MNLMSKIISLPSLLMNNNSSVFLASEKLVTSIFSVNNIFKQILSFIASIFYCACKWLMYIIDVIYFYILQLVGIGSDTTIFDSTRIDPTFRLLIDNKEQVTNIVKNFIAIAIILILVTAVIAIIKQQSQALKESKSKNGTTSAVLKSMLKSVLLLVLTPMIAIFGIIASSVILQGIYRATNLSDAKSLSSRVFTASAMSADKYRSYADNGVRIPIKYCFSNSDTDLRNEAILYAGTMIENNSFPNLDYFNDNLSFSGDFYDPVLESDEPVDKGDYDTGLDAWVNGTYYKYFDRSDDYLKRGSSNKYKKIETHKNEYYAMSDVVVYALQTLEPLYFVTIQDLLDTVKETENDELLKQVIEGYNVRLIKNDTIIDGDGTGGYTNTINAIKNGKYDYIQYTSKYKDGDHTYIHVKDATDEMEGAKFVIAYKNDAGSQYERNIYGDYYLDTTATPQKYVEVEKFFYRENNKSRYKSVDLFYTYNADLDKYEKAKKFETTKQYYYRLGEDYYQINSDNQEKFYFKTEDGYVHYEIGSDFYSLVPKEYFMPLASGVAVNDNLKFSSEYISTSCIITARGFFSEDSYPTAISKLDNGDIMFYRDDLEIITDGSVADVGTGEEVPGESDDSSEEDDNVFKKIGKGIKSFGNKIKGFVLNLFNPLKMIPFFDVDFDRLSSTYTNKRATVAELEGGEMHISYFFCDIASSALNLNSNNLKLDCLFEPLYINYFILIIGSVVLFRVITKAVFGIIEKSINLFIMFLIYPLACSTMPYDDTTDPKKGSYARWMDKFTKLLFSTFGLLLGINFVFIIIPVIDKIDFFAPKDLVANKALARIATALCNPWQILGIKWQPFEPDYRIAALFINSILRIIFQLAAFSLLSASKGSGDNFFSIIQKIAKPGGEGVLDDSPIDNVSKLLKKATKRVNSSTLLLSPKKLLSNAKDKAVETKKQIANNLPGSEFWGKEARERRAQIQKQSDDMKARDRTKKELIDAMKRGASKEEVKDKLQEFKKVNK